MISFQNSIVFLFFLTIPVYYILKKIGIFKRDYIVTVLADWNGKPIPWKGKSHRFFLFLSKLFTITAFVLSIFAYADPIISNKKKIFTSLGTDLIFAIDTSPSMAAKDIDNDSRLNSAKNSVFTLLEKTEGIRAGVVALGTHASLVVPVTKDKTFFTEQINSLQIGAFGDGSAIGDGISTAVYHLSTSQAPRKCIILLTDGENNAGEIHPETAANLAKNNNITLYVVGIGSKGTIPLEYTNPITGKNYSGYFDSNYDSVSLKKIAEIGNGHYYEAKSLENLIETLQNVAKKESITQKFIYKIEKKQLYKKFLKFAFILILITLFIKIFILREYKYLKFNKNTVIKTIFSFLSLLFLFCAYLGISWGTYMQPVQKNGNSIAMVFDISNSMLAKDCPEGNTRLKAASLYAKKLLEKATESYISVILTKGDAFVAVPLTQDFTIIESLLDVMSPFMMTNPGSNLGKGLEKARESLKSNESSAGHIWLFTDGEETDNSLQQQIEICTKENTPLSIIGFGNENESTILAGDGKTKIQTALRSEQISQIIDKVNKKFSILMSKGNNNLFVKASDKSSASRILSQLKSTDKDNLINSFEVKKNNRFKLFLFLSLIMFYLSYICSELNIKQFKSILLLSVVFITFSGCSLDTLKTFSGANSYHQNKYQKSISLFLDVLENSEQDENITNQVYSTYNLATSYLMLGEDEIALQYFLRIPQNVPNDIKYASLYNIGLIYFQKGDFSTASDYFKNAIKVDNSKLEAKLNMELSLQMIETSVLQNENNIIPATQNDSDEDSLDKKLFKHIKENEKRQWKNTEIEYEPDFSKDY